MFVSGGQLLQKGVEWCPTYRIFLMVPLGESHTGLLLVSLNSGTSQGCRRTLLQLKLLDSRLVRGDSGTLDSDAICLGSLGGIDSNLIIGLVTVFQPLPRCQPKLPPYFTLWCKSEA
jgi:hypothetical protein